MMKTFSPGSLDCECNDEQGFTCFWCFVAFLDEYSYLTLRILSHMRLTDV